MTWSVSAVVITDGKISYKIKNLWYLKVNSEIVARAFFVMDYLYLAGEKKSGLYTLGIKGVSIYSIIAAIRRLERVKNQREYSRTEKRTNTKMGSMVPVSVGIG